MKLSEVKAAPEQQARELLPEGSYGVTVLDAEPKTARTGTEGVALKLEVSDGKHKGRYLYDTFWLTPAAAWRAKLIFSALGFNLDDLGDELPESALIGRRAAVLVAHESYVGADGTAKERATVREWGEHPDGPGTSTVETVTATADDEVPF